MSTIHPDGLPAPQRYWSMAAIATGITMAVLDGSVANIALPAIARQLAATPAEAVWVVNSYQIAIVVTLLPLASLGERIGYRRIYIAGVAIFTGGSLACALSHSLPLLVASRVLQGLGAAGIMSMNGALVRYTYPLKLLGGGVGLNTLVVSIAAALGPSIASAILALGSWEWLFAVNVPIGLFNLVIATRALPYSPKSDKRFDWTSGALAVVMLGAFFVGVDALTHDAGGPWVAVAMLAAAVVAGAALFRREMKVAAPLIPLDLMRIPIFGLSFAVSICAFTAYMLVFLVLPFHFEMDFHRDQVATGLLMTPWPVALGFSAPLAGRLSDRVPAAVLGSVGLGLLALALVALALLPAQPSDWDIVWRMALGGAGFGLFQAPNNRTMLACAPRVRAGAAGGMLATARLLGMSAGATVAAVVFRVTPMHIGATAMLIALAFTLVGAAASLSRRNA